MTKWVETSLLKRQHLEHATIIRYICHLYRRMLSSRNKLLHQYCPVLLYDGIIPKSTRRERFAIIIRFTREMLYLFAQWILLVCCSVQESLRRRGKTWIQLGAKEWRITTSLNQLYSAIWATITWGMLSLCSVCWVFRKGAPPFCLGLSQKLVSKCFTSNVSGIQPCALHT